MGHVLKEVERRVAKKAVSSSKKHFSIQKLSEHLSVTRQGLYRRVMRYEAKLSFKKAVIFYQKDTLYTR